jgi:MFS family permease
MVLGADSTKTLMSPGGLVPTIPEIIEELGFGTGQLVTMLMACGVFLAEGLELMLVSLLSESMSRDLVFAGKDPDPHVGMWRLQEGFITSSIFAGALMGNLLSGLTVNKVGCQFLIIFGYSLIVIFSVVSSFMNSLLSISVLRFFVGLGFGFGQPAAIVLMGEALPSRLRHLVSLCAALFFGLGAIFAVLMVMTEDVWLRGIHGVEWRLLLRCAACPILLLGFCAVFFLPESPSFLAANADHALARDTLGVLRSRNKRPEVSVMFRELQAESWWAPLRQAFALSALPVTLVVCTSVLVQSFALYGACYAVPQVLGKVMSASSIHNSLPSTPVSANSGALVEVSSIAWWIHNSLAPTSVLLVALLFTAMILPLTWFCRGGQEKRIVQCLIASVFSAMLFNWITGLSTVFFFHRVVLVVACFGLCAGPALGLLFLAQATIAMSPCLKSASSVAASFCLGRLGPIVGPLMFDWMERRTGEGQRFFSTMVILELICLFLLVNTDFEPIQAEKPLAEEYGHGGPPAEPTVLRGWRTEDVNAVT